MTTDPPIAATDVHEFRAMAARFAARLGLAADDNSSVLQADAWIDSAEFRAAWDLNRAAAVAEVGA